jgi:RNA polymerase sigma-70 factor (ECF subfamily)
VLDPAVLELIEGQWPSPADGGEAQRVEALRQCVGALGADARRMLDLRYSQGRACAEVGRELGVGLEAVYQRLSRLHRSLRQCIEKRLSNAGGSAS